MIGVIEYGRERIHYEVRFLTTRQTLGIEVHPDSRVVVRAPVHCPEALIAQRVQKRAAWISRQLAEFERYRPRTPPRQYVSGESHLYLGRQYRLKVQAGEPAGVKLLRGQLIVSLRRGSCLPSESEPERVKALLRRWYLERAKTAFGDVLDASLPQFKGRERPRLIVRAMRSRWGSLSRGGTMTLNVNLIRAPRRCIEYVVTHELCHLEHRDHDAKFFRLLGRLMPDWERRKRRLEASLL
jgi:predicted metal-dependent hydrolase